MTDAVFRIFAMWALVRAQGCFAPSIVKALQTHTQGGDFLRAIDANATMVLFGKKEKDAGLLSFAMFVLECGEAFSEVRPWARVILDSGFPLLLTPEEVPKMERIAELHENESDVSDALAASRTIHFAGMSVYIDR